MESKREVGAWITKRVWSTQYKIVPFPDLAAGSVMVGTEEKKLNQLASDGWHVVGVIGECVIMERP